MFIDYYRILGISQTASLAEIKSAYRSMAMKWHPDRNHGVDTTEKMTLINEAKLILTDDEARVRYDKEYLNFISYQQANKKAHKKPEDKNEPEKSKEENSTYRFDDEILKKWMENARRQSIRNFQEMINEFRDSSIAGFGTFFKTALMAVTIGIIFVIISQILKAIIRN